MKAFTNMIVCPGCSEPQLAVVENTFPFQTFVHTCRKCSYCITESEWLSFNAGKTNYQTRVKDFTLHCFGWDVTHDVPQRNHRFLEEALELAQAAKCTKDEAHQLVEYVFSRPVGDAAQEVGGVCVTLAALCTSLNIDMRVASEEELARVLGMVDKLRAKHANKPPNSPLPQ